MNSATLSFKDENLYLRALLVLALEALEYENDDDNQTITAEDGETLMYLLEEHSIDYIVDEEDSNEHDQFRSDAEADGDALASAGFGTDEDYGDYGSDQFSCLGDED